MGKLRELFRVLNKFNIEGKVIWDCTGFQDNRGIAQEIANVFYIKRLFEITKAMKFILVVSEVELDFERGSGFVDTINRLSKIFADSAILDGCISLAITNAPPDRTTTHIVKSMENIAQDQYLPSEIISMLGYLKKSVYVFYKPLEEGPINIQYDLLEAINKDTEYVTDISTYTKVAVSEASMKYVPTLLGTAQNNFSEIVSIVFKAASEMHGCLVDQNNLLSQSWETVRKFLPAGQMAYLPLDRLPVHKAGEYFIDFAALLKLRDVAAKGATDFVNNTEDIQILLHSILQTFEEYIASEQEQEILKKQMQEYAYILDQQMEYIKFFSQLCGREVTAYLGGLSQLGKSCRNAIEVNLEQAARAMVVEQNKEDPEYYKAVIEYLKPYDQEWPVKLQATMYTCLAGLAAASDQSNEAAVYYLKSLQLDKKSPVTYAKLGDLLFKGGEYKAAINCYKAINNSFKVEACFERRLQLNPESPELMMEAADYFASIGRYEKAKKLYHQAFSFSQDENFKAKAWDKIGHILDSSQARAAEFIERAQAHSFYDFDLVQPEELAQLLVGDHHDPAAAV